MALWNRTKTVVTSSNLSSALNAQMASQAAYAATLNPMHGALIGTNAMAPRPRQHVTYLGERKAGQRIQTIDRKLMKLVNAAKRIELEDFVFFHLTPDQAIDEFGDYNPLYGGRPKKLTQLLLNFLPNPARTREFSVVSTGLIYTVPGLTGVRASRARTSIAGIELLQHWAKNFPRFEAFLLPYYSNQAHDQIIEECFDMAMGMKPLSFKAIDEKNKLYKVKWEAREYRRMMKEKEAAERLLHGPYTGQAFSSGLQNINNASYVYNGQLTGAPIWTSTLNGQIK